VISSRFADIFRNNALKGGLVPVIVPHPSVDRIHGCRRRRLVDRDRRRRRGSEGRPAQPSTSTSPSSSTTTTSTGS